MLSGCLPGTAYKEEKGPPHTGTGEGGWPSPAGGTCSLREPGIRQGRRPHRGVPRRRAHSLADHTFSNPILRTHYPKGLAEEVPISTELTPC